MSTSQNGWPAIPTYGHPDLKRLTAFPGDVRTGDVHTVLDHFAIAFNTRVEPLEQPVRDDWAFAPRKIAGTNVFSNHASGTALDLNAAQHPQFKRDTFTPAKLKALRELLAEYDGVIRWGGDYRANRVDEMHFEINAGAAAVKRLADKLRAAAEATGPKVPVAKTWRTNKTAVDIYYGEAGSRIGFTSSSSIATKGTAFYGTGRTYKDRHGNVWVEGRTPWLRTHRPALTGWVRSDRLEEAR